MGSIDVQVVIQLWQVVFAAVVGCGALVGLGFSAATVFVRRSECKDHKTATALQYATIQATQKELFDLIREVKGAVDFLRGKLED